MAKLTEQDKKLLIADYHTNRYSQRELSKKYNVSLGTVSNLTKELNPQNEHLVDAQIAILSAKSFLPPEHLNAILNTALEEMYNKNLVTNSSQLALVRATELLVSNSVDDKLNVGDGIQNYEPRKLNTSDLKNLIDTIDKASITLKVNDRFAPKSDVIQQNNNQIITVEIE